MLVLMFFHGASAQNKKFGVLWIVYKNNFLYFIHTVFLSSTKVIQVSWFMYEHIC